MTTLTPDFLTLRSNISAKTKNFVKPLLPVHMGPRSYLFSQNKWSKINGRKSCDTVPLGKQRKLTGKKCQFLKSNISLTAKGINPIFGYVVNFKVRMNCFEFQLDYFTNSEAIAIVSTLVFWCWHQHYKFN